MSPTRLRDRLRQAEALRLRAEGWSYLRIARQLGYGHKASAHRAVAKALQRQEEEAVRAFVWALSIRAELGLERFLKLRELRTKEALDSFLGPRWEHAFRRTYFMWRSESLVEVADQVRGRRNSEQVEPKSVGGASFSPACARIPGLT